LRMEWLREVHGEEEAELGIGMVIRQLVALFYADNGYIASTDPVMLQESLDILIALFEQVGLLTNTSKTKAETCVDRKICTRLSDESYFWSRAGFTMQRAWDTRRVECNICGLDLSANSLASHLETQHDVYQSKVINRDLLDDREPVTYVARQSPRMDPQTREWNYPSSALALEEVGLQIICHYVQKRCQTIAAYIVDRPIFNLCLEGRRWGGTSPRSYWWDQPMDLDLVREAVSATGVANKGA